MATGQVRALASSFANAVHSTIVAHYVLNYGTGSIVGYEQVYWYLAQTLARSEVVVLTWDAQGEGNSDQFGEGRDALEDAFAATPGFGFLQGEVTSDVLGRMDSRSTTAWEDALDFFLSTPRRRFVPCKSRSGTSHAAK